MNARDKQIDDWALAAHRALTNHLDLEPCQATGECPGVRCKIGAHRAEVYLLRIMDELAR